MITGQDAERLERGAARSAGARIYRASVRRGRARATPSHPRRRRPGAHIVGVGASAVVLLLFLVLGALPGSDARPTRSGQASDLPEAAAGRDRRALATGAERASSPAGNTAIRAAAGQSPAAARMASPAGSAGPTRSNRASPGAAKVDPGDAAQVQRILVSLRYLPPEAVSGRFDYRTSQAVLAFQSWEGLQRDGVVGRQTAGRLARAVTPTAAEKGRGRWVEVHRARGTVLLVQDGSVVRAVHCSSGRTMDQPPYDTPAGAYQVYAKAMRSWSVPYQVWLPYACYFSGGIALHGLADVPAFPASHGCVRLPMPEAPYVYSFVSVGTPVYVL